MAVKSTGLHLSEIVGLLNNKCFITESSDYWGKYKPTTNKYSAAMMQNARKSGTAGRKTSWLRF
jgi:hypothetical protein